MNETKLNSAQGSQLPRNKSGHDVLKLTLSYNV
jgi:hypothetical protein